MNPDYSQVQGKTLVGNLVVSPETNFAIVAGRTNAFIVDRLIDGAFDALLRHGAVSERITLVRAPGSWEIPLVCSHLIRSKKYDAIVAVSAVIRGGTPHFEFVAAEVTKGIAQLALSSGIPVTLGILTTDTIEQAVDRAGAKAGNKGFDAALAAIEMVSLLSQLNG